MHINTNTITTELRSVLLCTHTFFLYSQLCYIQVWLCWISSFQSATNAMNKRSREVGMITQQMGSKIWPEMILWFFYVWYIVKMYIQLKQLCIIDSDGRTLAIFLSFLNSESIPSLHDLSMFMSLCLCDAAKEITTTVHNHTQPDGSTAVCLHLNFFQLLLQA